MAKDKMKLDADDAPELTGEMMAKLRPATEALPDIVKRARGQRGPQKAATKERVTIRLDLDVLELYREGGAGWQTRLNDDLRALHKEELPQ